MSRKTWIKVLGEWKEVFKISMKIDGHWTMIKPMIKITGLWKCVYDPSHLPIPENAEIGDSFGGGKIAYIGPEFETTGGLIVHPEWDYEGGLGNSRQWGCYGTTVGRDNTELGAGYVNTEVAVTGECMASNHAPNMCWDRLYNGYSDWYLPSGDELNEMYENRNDVDMGTSRFWSSSEATNTSVTIFFSTGSMSLRDKSESHAFRPVRGR